MNAQTILVVDDDAPLREVVRYALTRAGFDVSEACDGAQALRTLATRSFDLVVLDVLMPEMDGLEVCRAVRATSRVPIVFLSSRGEELDKVLGLEIGGDDYLTKPFSPRELVSRVKAVLRRTAPDDAPAEVLHNPLQVGPIRLDPDTHRAWVGSDEIELTATEFRMLQVLMSRPGRVFTRAELVAVGYQGNHHVSDRTVDSHLRRIRHKLRGCGSDPIETVHGVGFRLEVP